MAKRTFSVDQVMTIWRICQEHVQDNKLWIYKSAYKMNDLLPVLHAKGTKCKVCGIEGTYFETYNRDGKKHVRLMTDRKDIFFTIDHTIPRTIGGTNHINNKEPLCSYCNSIWKSKFDAELKKKVIGFSVISHENQYLMIIE